MKRRFTGLSALMAAATLGAVGLSAAPAAACGGFFCSQTQPVNQAAERIIFANNGDGTVTAVIQIMYEGPAENFSWLLPISSVPDAEGEIAVASDIAFQRLQAFTNPQYNLTTRTEGTCRSQQFGPNAQGASPTNAPPPAAFDPDGESGVTVAASGVVGAFDWTALELDPGLDDPAGAALTWLTANGYDVLPQSGELIGPYLESGMYLLALKLTKGASTGSIRPIVLTYDGELPSIPIKLTAVAANEDMGVMTWMLSEARAVPFNYNALELNEARINWFNAASNYGSVVTAAANDSGGQGFVTEFAGNSADLRSVVWQEAEDADWLSAKSQVYSSFVEVFNATYYRYGSFDGFWDTVRANIVLPEQVRFEDFQLCPQCYAESIRLTPSTYLAAIEEGVIQPLRRVQQLIDAHPYVTRLYSTLSASDMTVDPVFTFNAGLPSVSNVHSAERIIECNPELYDFEAPWRIELPQGGVIRGTAADVGNWPQAVDAQPANRRVLTLSDEGEGVVNKDNSELINQMLTTYNASVPSPVRADPFMPGITDTPARAEPTPSMLPSLAGPSMTGNDGTRSRSNSGACDLGGGAGTGASSPGVLGMLAGLSMLVRLGARRRGEATRGERGARVARAPI